MKTGLSERYALSRRILLVLSCALGCVDEITAQGTAGDAQSPVSAGNFGQTGTGSAMTGCTADRKRASLFSLTTANVSISKLTVYVDGLGATSGSQPIKGVIYKNDGAAGAPGTLLCQTSELVIYANQAPAWKSLPMSGTCVLGVTGSYYLGMHSGATAGIARYGATTVAGALHMSDDAYADGPSNPWGTDATASVQPSIYASYTPLAPVNTASPTLSGTAKVGQTLSSTSGSWTGQTPLSYSYQWLRCNSSGASCANISGATGSSQTLGTADAGSTLKCQVTAQNSAGSASATSAASAVVQSSCVPISCSAQGKNCGSISDSCGGTLACGSCSSPTTCGGGGTANVCGGSGTSSEYDTEVNAILASPPSFTPSRTVECSTASQAASAIANIVAGDLVHVHTGVYLSGEVVISKQLASFAEIHFDTSSGFTGTAAGSSLPAVWVKQPANIRIYGGDITNPGGAGILVYDVAGPFGVFQWWGFKTHDTGADGFRVHGITREVSGVDMIGEVTNWSLDLSQDPHAEKGTGLHGANIADSAYPIRNSRFAVDAHDGNYGAGVEIQSDGCLADAQGHGVTLYARGRHLNFAAQSQSAGNVIQMWSLNGAGGNIDIKVAEGDTIQGRMLDVYYTGSSNTGLAGVKVDYGRGTNTLLNSRLSRVNYENPAGLVIGNCLPLP